MSDKAPIKLILARHGNTFESGETPVQVGSRSDMPLTAQGKTQAHDLAAWLSEKRIIPAAIYAGTLRRQTEAAKIVAHELHLEKKVHLNTRALNEVDYGLWEGLTAEEILAKWPHDYELWNTQAVWAEEVFGGTLQEHLEAIAKWLDLLTKEYKPGDTVVGITSNGIIRFFYSFVKEQWGEFVSGKQMESLKVKTGHFCELELYKDNVKVVGWNLSPKKNAKV